MESNLRIANTYPSDHVRSDPFETLTRLDVEDVVIKALFVKPELGCKIFPKLSRNTIINEENWKIIDSANSFIAEHNRLPGVKEFHDLYLVDNKVKEKFLSLRSVSISHYDETYLKEKLQEFVRLRLVYGRLMEASLKLRSSGDISDIDTKTLDGLSEAVSFTLDSKEGISAKDDMESFVSFLNTKNSYVPSFSPSINYYMNGGYASKALTVWYGESNVGKTTYLCNDAAYAFSCGYDVLYITLEMDKHEIMKKVIANLLEIPINTLKNYGVEYFENRVREISSSDFKVLEWPSFEVTSNDILETIRSLRNRTGFRPQIIFLDYINCMLANRSARVVGKKYEDLGFITKEIENIAKVLEVPVVTCSQFNRNGYGNAKAGAKDIGESIDIYKYSANGIAIIRTPDFASTGLYELNIIKNRYGPKDVSLLVKGYADIMKFRDASSNDVKSYTEEGLRTVPPIDEVPF